MSHRSLPVVSAAIAVAVLVPAVAAAQSAETAMPRTAWGVPDLTGVWDFRSITPLERPDELADKAFLTEEEAVNLEQETVQRNINLLNRPARTTTATTSVDRGEDGAPGFYNNFWLDRGTTTVGTRRTSLIVDPPTGKMPAMTAAAAATAAALRAERKGVLMHAPTPGGYNNNVQLFQTEDHVALLNEMNHNVRIVPLDGSSRGGLPQWSGESRGHWDGDTLVVETVNFNRETSFAQGRTDRHLRLVERFTRVSPDTLMYEATIDDPTVWTTAWKYEIPMQRNEQPLYEYACHEGNYGLYNILAGARAEEAAAEQASK